MNKIMILMLMMGFAVIGACASNDVSMEVDENSAEMADNADAKAAAIAEEAKAEMNQAKTDVKQAIEAEKPAPKPVKVAATAVATTSEDEAASAEAYRLVSTCNHGEQVRIISVVYNNEGADNVCRVDYEKSTGVQTLWTAKMDADYCMERAQDFITKQEGWGWICSSLE